MKILFIDHLYHARTKSSKFFIDILLEFGDVHVEYDDSLSDVPQCSADLSKASEYDLVVVWQMYIPALLLANRGIKNLLFVPMLDGLWPDGYDYRLLQTVKTVCFSSHLYYQLQKMGFTKLFYCRYYPQYAPKNITFDAVRPYFWQRRPFPSWKTIIRLLSKTNYQEINIHNVSDGSPLELPDAFVKEKNKIRITSWFDNKKQAEENEAKSNLYIAPRTMEGIGLGFLDAMASGLPVIAMNTPTHNEYIVHGVNGLMYDSTITPFNKADITPDILKAYSASQSYFVRSGHAQWTLQREYLKSFITDDPQYQDIEILADLGKLTVCIVVRNDYQGLDITLKNLSEQYCKESLRIVIIDATPSNKRVNLDYPHPFKNLWIVQEEDKGIYDGMNKAARHATTPYIVYINAGDTLYYPWSLAMISEVINSVEPPGIVLASFCYVDDEGDENIKWYNQAPYLFYKQIKRGVFLPTYFDGVPNHNSTILSTDLVRKYPYRQKEYPLSADTAQLLEIMDSEMPNIAVANTICCRFVSGGTSSIRRLRVLADQYKMMMKITMYPKKVKAFLKTAIPAELKRNIKLGLKFKDLWEIFKIYPITTAKALLNRNKNLNENKTI